MTAPFVRSRNFSLLLALVLILVAVPPAAADDFPPHWEGSIEIPGSALDFDVDLMLSDGTWTGDITIPAQGARDIALESITVDGDQIQFTISGVPGTPTFDGKREGDEVSGDFTQGPQKFPFAMKAGEDLAAKARERLAGIDEFIDGVLETFGVPGAAVAVVADGEVIVEKGYGVRDVEDGSPVTADTLFAIGSTSKAFTAFILGTLVDEGKLEWDEPVRTYLPDFRLWDAHATQRLKVRDLLIHSSGLPRHDLAWYGSPATRAEIYSRLRYLEPTRDLGETYQYQNLMYMTAGYLAERITGKTWEELVAERIFAPLGIERANFSVEDSKKDSDAAAAHIVEDRTARKIPYRNIDAVGPAGSINASASTASKWMQMLLMGGKAGAGGEQIIEPSTLQEMVTPRMAIAAYPSDQNSMLLGYGLGWMLEAHRGKFVAHHGGGIDGFISWIAVLPHEGVGVAVYTNGAGLNPVTNVVGRTVIDRVLGLEEIDYAAKAEAALKEAAEAQAKQEEGEQAKRVADTQLSHSLDAYAGEYEHPGYGELVISEADAGLALAFNGMSAGLEHWHYDTFNAVARNEQEENLEDTKITFRTNAEGQIDALSVVLEPASDAIVFDRAPDANLEDPEYLQRFVGEYELDSQIAKVSLSGTVLKVSLPGQPVYTLEPKQGAEFGLAGLSGFSLEFTFDDGGAVSGARFLQPNGIFEAKRR